MAKSRYINTHIWKDPWFIELRLSEQHLFLYLLTNPQTNIHGVYEISMREMAFDTTIEQEEIKRIFRDRFQPDGKAFYEVGWVVLKNFLKHQTLNPKTAIAVATHYNSLPLTLRKQLIDKSNPLSVNYDSLTIGYGYTIESLDTNPNLNPNLNLNPNPNRNGGVNKKQLKMGDGF